MNDDIWQWLTPDERREWAKLAKTYAAFQIAYRDFPQHFATDALTWRPGESLYPYQSEIIGQIPTALRVCVRSLHGVGKTALAAIVVIWFALTRDGVTDWKIVTTASAWRQLQKYLWPEIHKWAGRVRWEIVGREPFGKHELLDLALKLRTGEAFAVASDNVSLIEGAHASSMLYLFDESKAIPGATFDGAEGAFTQGGVGNKEAFAFAISTPGDPTGRFYEIQSRKAGFEDWLVRRITLEEAVAAGQVSSEWAASRLRQWGEKSAVYRNRVLGEFASDDENGIIPLAWVEAANERYREWRERQASRKDKPVATYIGVDVARSGADKTKSAILVEEDDLSVISEIRTGDGGQDTMVTTGQVRGIVRATGAIPVVDVNGIGAGVVDRLRELKVKTLAFNSSFKTDAKDRSGELGFTNLRSAAMWTVRERLDPASPLKPVALPPDDKLTGDLTTPRWRIVSGGAIQVESKEEIKKRLDGRSTDDGDAVMQALAAALVPDTDAASTWEIY